MSYELRPHADGYQVYNQANGRGLSTHADILDALRWVRVCNREKRLLLSRISTTKKVSSY